MARKRRIKFSFFGSAEFLSLMKSFGGSFAESAKYMWHTTRKASTKTEEGPP